MNMKRFLLLSLLFGLLPGLASAAWTHGPGVRTPHTLLDALSADEAPGRTDRASLQPRTDTGDSLLLVGSVISTGNTSIRPMGLYSFTEGGTPRVPAPALTYEDGVCKVTWKAVTSTLDGGFFSTAELYYRVTRLGDGKVLADSVRGLEYADTLGVSDRLSKHQYAVQAHFRGNFSNPGKTTAVVSGSIVAPPSPTTSTTRHSTPTTP